MKTTRLKMPRIICMYWIKADTFFALFSLIINIQAGSSNYIIIIKEKKINENSNS